VTPGARVRAWLDGAERIGVLVTRGYAGTVPMWWVSFADGSLVWRCEHLLVEVPS